MFTEKDLVRVAKRENNKKRNYLVVNRLQAKHVPVSPKLTLTMFSELADIVKEGCGNEQLLLIGFAETATAIGAGLAIELNSYYMQTTRENIPDVEYLYFSEAHSHAVEQRLIKDDLDLIINRIDRIVFVEDEVTTGNTIMNIVRIINDLYPGKVKFAVASILNGMDAEAMEIYNAYDIDVYYLVKTNHGEYPAIADSFKGDGEYITDVSEKIMPEINVCDFLRVKSVRRLIKGESYELCCEKLWEQISDKVEFEEGQRVLVLGTEELMYPAIYVSDRISEAGCRTQCHSTTRSPITVSMEDEYPLHTRYELRSVYDDARRTFIYDIGTYDKVVVITDTENVSDNGIQDLCKAVYSKENTDITLVRWCD